MQLLFPWSTFPGNVDVALSDGRHHLLSSDLSRRPDRAIQLTLGVARALIWCVLGCMLPFQRTFLV